MSYGTNQVGELIIGSEVLNPLLWNQTIEALADKEK